MIYFRTFYLLVIYVAFCVDNVPSIFRDSFFLNYTGKNPEKQFILLIEPIIPFFTLMYLNVQ